MGMRNIEVFGEQNAASKALPLGTVLAEQTGAALTADEAEEIRRLVSDLRDAAQDGRWLARRYADLMVKTVDEYCVEFEARAQAALRLLDRVS